MTFAEVVLTAIGGKLSFEMTAEKKIFATVKLRLQDFILAA